MRIAVTSQNATVVTGHAGRCRTYLVFELVDGAITGRTEVALDEPQTFHQSHHALPLPLVGISALITGGMGEGLHARLTQLGITPVITTETSPEAAALAFAAGTLVSVSPHSHKTL